MIIQQEMNNNNEKAATIKKLIDELEDKKMFMRVYQLLPTKRQRKYKSAKIDKTLNRICELKEMIEKLNIEKPIEKPIENTIE